MKPTRMLLSLGFAPLLVAALAGCEDEARPPATAAVVTKKTTTVVETTMSKPEAPPPTVAHVVIDPRIAAVCNMPEPHFEFDSARVGPDAGLDALAACFKTGPMVGRDLRLVGHADPRGDFDYNMALGQRRAGNVATYLEDKGVGESRIATLSRGEMDASGTDDTGWALDRRVDVVLVD